MVKNIGQFLVLLALLASSPSAQANSSLPPAHLQFFGDVWIPYHVVKATASTPSDPKLFAAMQPLLSSAEVNVINFEGVASYSFIPYEYKRFLLKMPLSVPAIMRSANIHVATLANNHAMDYGYLGLFETTVTLNDAGIETLGAGVNLAEAVRPKIIVSGGRSICLLAFSRSLPETFWAKENKSGTASVDFTTTGEMIRDCVADGHFTIPIYHWGQELATRPKDYQKTLARLSIREGAGAVIGHHPHVLQSIEWYEGKPIFYSLGNFAFGSVPLGKKQNGMAVRLRFTEKKPTFDIVPLNVNNDDVRYVPRPLAPNEEDPVSDVMLPGLPCKKDKTKSYWTCS